MSGFSKKVATSAKVPAEKKEKAYVRQTEDNKIFPDIQVRDISTVTDESTVGIYDADSLVYSSASNVEVKYIEVQHNTEEIYVELKGAREFKGQTKAVSEVSWLGILNTKRAIQKLPTLLVEDFTITPKSKLKYDTVEEAMEKAKINIFTNLKKLRAQFGLGKITLSLGEGDTFRNKLHLCRPYKGNRTETLRPIILKKLRAWVLSDLDSMETVPRADGENVENDDTCEYYARLGYVAYRRTGVFSYYVIASDKDAMSHAKLLVNPDCHSGEGHPLRGKYKYPHAMLIEATDKTVGDVDLVINGSKKDFKGYGLKFLVFQCALGIDGADNYSALKHLDRKFNYGEVSAYEDLYPLKTATEVLQKAVDIFAELLPFGVQYTTHDGVDLDVDCMEYMDTYFKVAYMLKTADDDMDFYKLCAAFKVDTSAIVGNNKLSAPVLTFIPDKSEKVVDELKVMCDNVLPDMVGFKTLKKGDLVALVEEIVSNTKDVNEKFSDFYEMVQQEKTL